MKLKSTKKLKKQKMKRIIIIMFIVSNIASYGQSSYQSQTIQTKEYASLYVRVLLSGNNIIYQREGVVKSPVLYMPDGKDYIIEDNTNKDSIVEFSNVTQIINYMAKYGWIISSSFNMTHSQDYIQEIYFERPVLILEKINN